MTTRVGVLRFGQYLVDCQSGEISENGSRLKLQDQPFQILVALLERPGEVVTREEIRQRLWPGDTFVDFDNSVNIAVRKLRLALKDDPLRPTFIETLPKRGYRFLAAVEPTVADEAPEETAKESMPAGPVEVSWHRFPAPITLVGAGLTLVVLAAVLGYLGWGRRGQPVSASVKVRPAVAILGFRNLAAKSDRAWVSTALAEMITSELAAAERLRTIPGENVARARIDLALPEADSFARSTLDRIRKNLGADFVVTGAYFDAGTEGGGKLRLDLRLEDARDGGTLWAATESGSEADLPDLVARAGLALRAKLGAGQVALQAAVPARSDAVRLYAEGLDRLRQFDAKAARDLLERAVATAPEYAPAHSALAAAWYALGYAELARQEARKARDLAAGLPRAERMSIEARFHESVGEWDKAIAIYRRLGDLFPDSLDYGLRLAAAQVKAGKGREALATVDLLRRKPPAIRDEPALDYAQSSAANEAGDFPQAQAAAARSAAQAEVRGERMLVADARLLECRELEALGRMSQAKTSCETAKGLYAQAGDRAGVASVTGYLAAALDGAGDRTAAEEMYRAALSIQRDIGNQGGALWDVNGLAEELLMRDDYAGARRMYQEALQTAREIASRPDAADALANIGYTWLLEGDLGQGQKACERALAEFRAMGNLSGVGNTLNNLGDALYFRGDLAGAGGKLEEALTADRRSGEKGETADALAGSGRVRLASGDLVGARARLEESLQAWRDMGETYTAAVRLPLAELDIESGRLAVAEGRIRECLQMIQGKRHTTLELAAHTLLARVLLLEGKRDEARREVELAAPMAASCQSRARRLQFAIAAARVEGGAAFRKALDAAGAEARQFGFAGLQFEAQLALGENEIANGRDAAGLGRLRRLEQEARSRGFETIARAAKTAEQKSTPR